MNQRPVQLGIIGYGGMARYHAERLKKNGIMQVVGTFDIDPMQQQAASKEGYVAYPTQQALLADKNIEAVLIATPNDCHCAIAIAAANAGKHIICEKPVALSVAELDSMEAAAKQNGVIFTVHQNRRWDPDYIAARNIMQSGVLGKMERIDTFVCGANGIPGGWRKIESHGGGMMLDWGVHILDQIFDCIRQKPISLYCRYSHVLGFAVDDGFYAQIEFEDDLTVHAHVSTNTYIQQPRWTLYGRDGTAQISDWDVHGKIILPVYGKEEIIEGIAAGNGFTKTMAYRPHESVRELPVEKPQVDADAFYKNFAAAVRGKEQPVVSVASVRKILRLMELCALSDRENAVLKTELKSL